MVGRADIIAVLSTLVAADDFLLMLNLPPVREIQNMPHFAALRHRDYRRMWAANMFSGGAMWTFIVASAWLVLERSDSSGWVGIIAFSGMIPFLIVSPVAGLMADRLERR